MVSLIHRDQPVDEIHIPYNWSYADATARAAATGFVSGDVGKLALQEDDNTLWILTAITPTWVAVSQGFANPMTTQDDIIVGGASGVPARKAKGTASQYLAVDPSTLHLVWRTVVPGDISGFDTQVRTSRLDQMAAPTADISMNTHKITNVTDPASAQDAATKNYVDALAQGISWKNSVRVATTANGTLATAYENGDTVDGVTLATGDRILLKNQTSGAENGIYIVATSGAPTRSTDADTAAEILQAAVFVREGTTNADTMWVNSTNGPITLNTTALVFVQLSGGGGSALTVEEVDGSPTDAAVTKIVFPNGTLAIASHVATYTPASGGGGGALEYVGKVTAAGGETSLTAPFPVGAGRTLRFRGRVRKNTTGTANVYARPNNDSTAAHYDHQNWQVSGGSVAGSQNSGDLPGAIVSSAIGTDITPADTWVDFDYTISEYQVAKNKFIVGSYVRYDSGLHIHSVWSTSWLQTAAITSLVFFIDAGAFAAGSEIAIYVERDVASVAVSPVTMQTKTLIEEITLAADGTISFQSIPQTYDDLIMEIVRLRGVNAGANFDNAMLRVNNDSSNNYGHGYVQATTGGFNSALAGGSDPYAQTIGTPGSTSTADNWALGEMTIPRYAIAEKHFSYGRGTFSNGVADIRPWMWADQHDQAVAITRLDLINKAGTAWLTGSVVRLYGVKKSQNVGGVASLLAYDANTDLANNLSLAANTWVDLVANMNFTVVNGSAEHFLSVSGSVVAGVAGAIANVRSRAVIDSAGTPVTLLLGAARSPSSDFANPLSGAGQFKMPALTAGLHTIKIQIKQTSGSTGAAYCQPGTNPNDEFFRILITEGP